MYFLFTKLSDIVYVFEPQTLTRTPVLYFKSIYKQPLLLIILLIRIIIHKR